MSRRSEKKTEPSPTRRVVLRLPESIADRHQGDWTGLRELLSKWVSEGDYLDPVTREPTRQVCFSLPTDTAEALEDEAERLTEATGERWTVSRVVSEIWARDAP